MTAFAVCGFGRCGSTMLMGMLDRLGIPPAGDVSGGYEVAGGVDAVTGFPAEALNGHSVKLLDSILHGLWPTADVDWKIVWLDRDHTEQAASMVKFATFLGVDMNPGAAEALAASYADDRPGLLAALREKGSVLEMDYASILSDPYRNATLLRAFVDPDAKPSSTVPLLRAASHVHFRTSAVALGLDAELNAARR